jgi:alkanesulfonate monooxygenase SsuD/methylene tetrahydromethanopterin reductase-like flavin-dependent oxidoreductase (luciferase family)
MWVAGSTEADLQLVAEAADGWTTIPPGFTEDDPEVFRRQVERLRRLTMEAGRDPDELDICISAVVCVTENEAQMEGLRDNAYLRWWGMMFLPNSDLYAKWGIGEHPMGPGWMYARKCVPHWLNRQEAMDIINRTPRAAAEKLLPYLKAGATHVLLTNAAPITGVPDLTPALMKALKTAE